MESKNSHAFIFLGNYFIILLFLGDNSLIVCIQTAEFISCHVQFVNNIPPPYVHFLTAFSFFPPTKDEYEFHVNKFETEDGT